MSYIDFTIGTITGVILSLTISLIVRLDNFMDKRKHMFMLKNGFIFRSATTKGYEAFEYYREKDNYCIPEKYVLDSSLYLLKKRYKLKK